MRAAWLFAFGSTATLAVTFQPAFAQNHPPEFAALKQIHDTVLSPNWVPTARLASTNNKLPKTCSQGAATVEINYLPITKKIGKPGYEKLNGKKYSMSIFRETDGRYLIMEKGGRYVTMEKGDADKFLYSNKTTPVRYQGEAFGCKPKGKGVITYADGSLWVGEVESVKNYDWPVDLKFALPMRKNIGMRMSAREEFYPLEIVKVKTTVTGFTGANSNSQVPALEYTESVASQLSADGPWRAKMPMGGTSYDRVKLRFADGGVLSALFKDGKVVKGSSKDDMPQYLSKTGVRVDAPVSDLTNNEPVFSSIGTLRLTRKVGELPAGGYFYNRSKDEATNKRIMISQILKPENYARFSPNFYDAPEMVKDIAFANPKGCVTVPGIPADWRHWWLDCSVESEEGGARSMAVSPDGKLVASYNGKLVTFAAQDGRYIRAASFGDGPVMTPVGVQFAHIPTELGRVYYTGPFAGMRPDGEGFCAKNKSTEPEPCTFLAGVRNDETYLARLEDHYKAIELAKRQQAEREAQALYEQEQQRIREAQQRAAEEREQRRQERLAEIERANRRAATAAAISGAFNDVARSVAQSNLEMQNARIRRQSPQVYTSDSLEVQRRIRENPSSVAKQTPIYTSSPSGSGATSGSGSGLGGNGGNRGGSSPSESRSTAEFRAIREQQARNLAEIENSQMRASAERARSEADAVAYRAQLTATREAEARADAAREAQAASSVPAASKSTNQSKPLDLYLVVKKEEPYVAPPAAVKSTTASAPTAAPKGPPPPPSKPINPNAKARER